MSNPSRFFRAGLLLTFLLLSAAALAQALEPIDLPKPQTTGGKPLMEALSQRSSAREFSTRKLSPQVLSNLLWAAFGINRPDGRRTAPSANNRQEIDIYVTLPDGAYMYDAKAHRLTPDVAGDIRAKAGRQAFVADAPLNLVYVADYAKTGSASEQDKAFYAAAGTGFIGENVYLYCASEGLVTVVRAMVDRPALAQALKLRPEQHITLSQTVGYPKQ